MNRLRIRTNHLLIFAVLLSVFGVSITLAAFQGPPASPPTGNAVLNVNASGQLVVATTTIFSSQICFEADCRSAWPAGGAGAYWALGSNNSIYYSSSTNPRVGIGTSNPDWYFKVYRTATETIPGDNILAGSNYWVDSLLASNLDAHFKGLYGFVGGTTNDSFGSFIGSHGFAYLSGVGTVDNIIGAMGTARIANGNSSRLSGLLGQVIVSSGSASSASGLFIETPTIGGTLTNLRGIYIGNQDVVGPTNKYALYYDGASKVVITADSNVGIGTATPAYKLDVSGNVRGTQLCIGIDCRSAWPGGAGGSISGSGTSTQIAYFNTSSSIVSDSNLFWNPTSGYLGIGTSAPDRQLHIRRASDAVLHLEASTGDSDTSIDFTEGGPTTGVKLQYKGNADQLQFIDKAPDIVRIVFTRVTGRIGIGTTTPAYALDAVGGDVRATGYVRGDAGVCVAGDCRSVWPSGGGGGTSYWTLGTGGIYYTSSTNPNVGIGTSSPGAKLDVVGTGRFSGTLSLSGTSGNILSSSDAGLQTIALSNDDITGVNNITISDDGFGEGIDWGGGRQISVYNAVQGGYNAFVLDSTSTHPFVFRNANVGIGVTVPAYALDVSGDAQASGYVRGATGLCIGADCRIAWPAGGISGNGTATQLAFFTGATAIGSDANLFWDGTNQRLGIGTIVPNKSIHIRRTSGAELLLEASLSDSDTGIKFTEGGPTIGFEILYQGSTNQLRFIDTAPYTPRVVFERTTGRVGIGTNSPQAALEVNGGVRLFTSGAKPSCSLVQHGTIWFTQDVLNGDKLEVCTWNIIGNFYEWKSLIN